MEKQATIYALSSAPGRAGVAVVRISGPDAKRAISAMAPPAMTDRQVAFRAIKDPDSRETLDKAVVIFFAGPKSETGEDIVEFQLHGSPAVVSVTLAALGKLPGFRLAEPGEFARRAFLNGKADLTAIEGLADLIDAETDAQRRQALAQAGGALSRLYEGWRNELISVAALTEAAIDFSDEGDVSSQAFQTARQTAEPLLARMEQHINDGFRGEIIRDGFRVALLGPPNAGKSSLLNALARRDAAIVTSEAGTTRDVVEVRLDLDGLPVIVSDTAGIRETEGEIEREGIRRSFQAAENAHLVLWLTESGDESPRESFSRETILAIRTKADLDSLASDQTNADALAISSKTGAGLPELIEKMTEAARNRIGTDEAPAITQVRHRMLISESIEALKRFLSGPAEDVELRAEDVRQAAHSLGRITGRVDVEDVLDQIFGRFCIGK